jgi:hypothetical protein
MKRWLYPLLLIALFLAGLFLATAWASHSAFPTFTIAVDDSAAWAMRAAWAFAVYIVVVAQSFTLKPEPWESTLTSALLIAVPTWAVPEFVVLIGLFYGGQFLVRTVLATKAPKAKPAAAAPAG